MAQSLSRVLVHLIFSTKDRAAVIDGETSTELYPYLAGVLENIGCVPLQVGGWKDHVHALFGISRTLSISQVVEKAKTSSSKWIKGRGDHFAQFHWQGGYGAFSVSQSDSATVIRYIRDQERHHQRMTFQDEFRKFLERYEVPYDERYVWD